MNQVHVQIIGSVQGIGYRQFAKKEARRRDITGWVRNLPDGSVEALLQGEKADLDGLLKKLKQGPFMADVKDMQIDWEDMEEQLSDFVILPSV